MKRLRILAGVALVLASIPGAEWSSRAQGGAANSGKPMRPQPVRHKDLFIGRGSVSCLPKSSMLPVATDIDALAQKLSSRLRNVDPFGLATFPREDSQPALLDDGLRQTPRVTLNQALQTLHLNGINLQTKEFLIGGRNVFEGDVIELAFKGEVFQAQVIEVGTNQVLFRDLRRGETGILQHTLLPQLQLEPMRKTSGLEGRVAPMETPNSRNHP